MLVNYLLLLVPQGIAALEEMDGFMCARVVSPDGCPPDESWMSRPTSRFLPNGRLYNGDSRPCIVLLKRHWNAIVADFALDGLHLPIIGDVVGQAVPGRAWARGFMRGVGSSSENWHHLFRNENEGFLISIALMAGMVDPSWPRAPLSADKTDELITWMTAGALRSYEYFARYRSERALALFDAPNGPVSAPAGPTANFDPAIGRIALCPCGSHRKYKRCCGEFRTR